ncbi:glycosyltransferase [Pseudomonas putida]|uniref:glycosyltransferase n=1 Tax=unclassified Pseudomonas TaxID=196821 RepID=UPI00255710C5|nr:glycosyltransferase [Pseudomonas sp. M2(2023)]MDY4312261.1 glycosyltransferase [Pseudomonas putida]MDY4322547.1 glycosyltransferase [Pseudomonas putida]MDY4355937.1 glycosyltransferase [Pseudomonas putida]WIV25322.1 glycosyltransferase [Pseudomonas sp. M2(2023)]
MGLTMIYLDITRIFNRVNASSPTGIDRVEFEYAKNSLEKGHFFAYQKRNELFSAPRYLVEMVVAYLAERWEKGREEDPRVEHSIKEWAKSLRLKPMPKPTGTVKFLRELKGKTFKERLSAVRSEADYIKKKAPQVPSSIATLFVALFHDKILKKFEAANTVNAPTGIHWNKVFERACYLNVGHTGLEKKALFEHVKASGVQVALYLHDLLPMTHPHLFVEGTDKTHKVRMDNMAAFSDLIFANSFYTKEKFEELYGSSSVAGVLEIGSQELTKKSVIAANQRKNFVSIGTIEPRKNYLWLVRAWDSYCQKNPNKVKEDKLIIFGKVGWLKDKELSELQKLAKKSNIEIISGASDELIQTTLSQAKAYVTAAEVEGWGMPLAESLSYGTPVIATDVAAHREVTRNTARFFEFNNVDEFHSHLDAYYIKQQYEVALSDVTRYAPWQWKSHFDRLAQHINGQVS